MRSVITYFKNIINACTTLFEGMTITSAYMVQKPITVEYPNKVNGEKVVATIEERFRGLLFMNWELCTTCGACARDCPLDIIIMDGVRIPGKKGKVPYFFSIDQSKCMYCGHCVEACPTDALYFTKNFEGSSAEIRDLVTSYIPENLAKKILEDHKKAEAEKAAAAAAAPSESNAEQQVQGE
jgi:NADH-quinone oxidoreductase subunit I